MLVTIIAYAVSPIDLIPDFIPLLGYLDDLLLLPLGIALALWLIPAPVIADCRARVAAGEATMPEMAGRWAAVVIVALWVAGIMLVVRWARRLWAA